MEHGKAVEWKEEQSSGLKTKLGLYMFALYTVVYIGFIVINFINPKIMSKVVGSQNVAIIYGVGLIFFALVLALVYNAFCTAAEKRLDGEEGGQK